MACSTPPNSSYKSRSMSIALRNMKLKCKKKRLHLKIFLMRNLCNLIEQKHLNTIQLNNWNRRMLLQLSRSLLYKSMYKRWHQKS